MMQPNRSRLRYLLGYRCFAKPALYVRFLAGFRKPGKTGQNTALNAPVGVSAWKKAGLANHYLEGRYVEGVRKVAWVTSGAPIEILRALGFYVFYPENHGALCGARKVATEIMQAAEQQGYSPALCSYARTDLGSLLSGKTPLQKIPRPDLLLACTNICQTVLSWYRCLAEYLNVPLYLIDTPFLFRDATPDQIDYVKRQLEGLIPVAEQVAGRSLKWSRLRQVVSWSKEATQLWLEVLETAKAKPSPLTAFDGFIHMAPIVEQRGETHAIRYYRDLLKRLQNRIQRREGAVKEERFRVLWDNLPVWYRLRHLAEFLAERGVNVVASTYTYAWAELAPMMDSNRPLETIARTYLHVFLNRPARSKLKVMEKMIHDFQIDGVILHSDRSCKPYSLGQMDQRDHLVSRLNVPALLLEADHNDSRAFAEQQIRTRLEAFVEMMEQRK